MACTKLTLRPGLTEKEIEEVMQELTREGLPEGEISDNTITIPDVLSRERRAPLMCHPRIRSVEVVED